MIPYLDECVREYSDMQAEVVQHIHSENGCGQTKNVRRSGIGKSKNVAKGR